MTTAAVIARGWRSVRSGAFLPPDRARAYAMMLAAGSLALGAGWLGLSATSALHDPAGRPINNDFNAFWSAGRLALHGHARLAYDLHALLLEEQVGAQPVAGQRMLPFMYPPVFLLFCLPFAALPFLLALPVFVLGGYGVFVASIRRLLPRGWPWLPLLGFPGAVIDAASMQNGWLSAACFAGAAFWLEERPVLAGAALGVFAFKPHLGLCIPLALAGARRWTALAACAVSACLLTLLSWAVLGNQAWAGFVAAIPATQVIVQLPNVIGSGCSVYAAAVILGASHHAAAALQVACALAAMAALWRVARRRHGGLPEMAALACAALLCTPYVMDYDLICLAIPLAWLARACAGGGRPWEKAVLAIAYPYALAARVLTLAGVPASPLVVAGLLTVVLARNEPLRVTQGKPSVFEKENQKPVTARICTSPVFPGKTAALQQRRSKRFLLLFFKKEGLASFRNPRP